MRDVLKHTVHVDEKDEVAALEKVVSDLGSKFPHVPEPVIRSVVRQRYARFVGAPVRDYIPVMVRREASEELRMLIRESKESHPSIAASRRHA